MKKTRSKNTYIVAADTPSKVNRSVKKEVKGTSPKRSIAAAVRHIKYAKAISYLVTTEEDETQRMIAASSSKGL